MLVDVEMDDLQPGDFVRVLLPKDGPAQLSVATMPPADRVIAATVVGTAGDSVCIRRAPVNARDVVVHRERIFEARRMLK